VTTPIACTYLTAAAAVGATAITVNSCGSSPTGILANSEILIHQTQSQSSPGTYAFAAVLSVSGTTPCVITLKNPLTAAFTTPSIGTATPEVAQVVPVPHYTNLAITSGILSPPAWNGQCGGLLAIRASGSISIAAAGAIDASGLGFRGSLRFTSGSDYVQGYVGEGERSGYTLIRSNLAYGSVGGAGIGRGGGYGGAHGSIGTAPNRGGCDSLAANAPSLVGQSTVSTSIFFGGSGSSSGSHSGAGRDGASGGTSGGIIFLAAGSGVTNAGKIGVNGGNGENGYYATAAAQPIGGGGGGASGLIWIRSGTTNTLTSALQLNGGNGGAQFLTGSCTPGGAGGSGGLGRSIVETSMP